MTQRFYFPTLGKFGNDNDFDEYGASFAKDDVVSAFVDFTGDTVVFSFSKNGEDQVDNVLFLSDFCVLLWVDITINELDPQPAKYH